MRVLQKQWTCCSPSIFTRRLISFRRLFSTESYPNERTRTFCIVAHVDHGKSTLANRFIEACRDRSSGYQKSPIIDRLKVEQERGITVKAQSVSLIFSHFDGQDYLLNLIDTPGHLDFQWEVRRSISSCRGAVLLVDATQGVQAQTVSNYRVCQRYGLMVIPVLNKIDAPHADIAMCKKQMKEILGISESSIISVSAKTGQNIETVLEEVVESVPPLDIDSLLGSAFVLDSHFDSYRGIVAMVLCRLEAIRRSDSLYLKSSKFRVHDVGLMTPMGEEPREAVKYGQMGYVVLKNEDPYVSIVGKHLVDYDGNARGGRVRRE